MSLDSKLTSIKNEIVKLQRGIGSLDKEKVEEAVSQMEEVLEKLEMYKNYIPDITYEEI